jgi:hypothetical protein
MNVEDTAAITSNYASLCNIDKVWKTLIDFEVKLEELEKVYCHVLNQKQRDEVEFDCDCTVFSYEL